VWHSPEAPQPPYPQASARRGGRKVFSWRVSWFPNNYFESWREFVGSIRQIEKLGSKFHVFVFCKQALLEHGEIHTMLRRAVGLADGAAPVIAWIPSRRLISDLAATVLSSAITTPYVATEKNVRRRSVHPIGTRSTFSGLPFALIISPRQ
jgi:hypothetical protein